VLLQKIDVIFVEITMSVLLMKEREIDAEVVVYRDALTLE